MCDGKTLEYAEFKGELRQVKSAGDAHVKESAGLALDVLENAIIFDEQKVTEIPEIYPEFKTTFEWLSQKVFGSEDIQKVVDGAGELFEISDLFLEKIETEKVAKAFVNQAAELAYSITRCSYWMIRAGVPQHDHVC